MADENSTRIISISQDYLILGKSTKDTEIKIYVHGEDWESSRKKVSNMIRLASYAEALNEGRVALPPKPFDSDGKEVGGSE